MEKEIKYYHKNSNKVALVRTIEDNGWMEERTFDENGNLLTYNASDGVKKIKGKNVDGYEFYKHFTDSTSGEK